MADKTGNKPVANDGQTQQQPGTQQQAQVPQMWNYQMYNMYGMYNMYPNYSLPYYQFLANNGGYPGASGVQGYQQQQGAGANPQQMLAMEAYKNSFTSGGTLMPFSPPNTPQANTNVSTSGISMPTNCPTTGTPTKSTSNVSTTSSTNNSMTTTKVEEIELPPLPPGPPPPSVPPPPPPGPAPSPPPPPPPDTPNQQQQQQSYQQYMGFNSQQMYNKVPAQYQQQFVPQQNQYGNQGNNQNQQYAMYQQQQQQQQQGYANSGGSQQQQKQQSNTATRWNGGEKESRWSQPSPVRFNQPNRNNNRFNNQQDGPIRFNMRGRGGRLKTPLLPNPEWKNNKWNQGGNKQSGGMQQPEDRRVTAVPTPPTTQASTPGASLSDEETLRKLVDGWPDNLKSYVDRCFAKCPPDKKDKLTVVLKSQLIKAAENGSLWCKQWQFEPLPQLDDEDVPRKKSLESRLGSTESKSSQSGKKKKKDRTSRGQSSGSESDGSNPDGYLSFNSSSSSSKKKNKSKDKKKNKYKHNVEDSHYWSEYGIMNGGKVETKKEVLDKRAARFNADKGSSSKQAKSKTPAQSRINSGSGGGNNSSSRFGSYQQSPSRQQNMDSFAMDVDTDFDISSCHIVGTCRDIEKPYLRLTTAPEPCQVRPPDVLRESLDNVKTKWVENRDYRYICEQLKSIRQDLTVQGIRDEFTVLVYETHARIALETGDHAEFNQCQSQLTMLHKEHNSTNRHEFTAYRLLYFIFTQDFMDVNTMLMMLGPDEKKNVCISHAVSVMKAWLSSNYDKMFRLYKLSPRMSSYLMDWFMSRERKQAVKIIIKSYRPTIPTELLLSKLAFPDDTKLLEFLEPLQIVYSDPAKKIIDCKLSTASLA